MNDIELAESLLADINEQIVGGQNLLLTARKLLQDLEINKIKAIEKLVRLRQEQYDNEGL